MEVKDLMYKDWVNVNGKPEQVRDIITSASDMGINPNWSDNEASNIKGEIDLSPIPITPEILEKNGWVRLYYVNGYIEKYRGNMDIEQFRGQNSWTIFDGFVDIKYVHELQHALKLIGIDKEIIID